MNLLRLTWKSLHSRLLTVMLTVLAVALSVALLLGVEKVRTGAKASFADTISDTDLIFGARSGSVQLLLYSIFRIGNATNNVTWESYSDIAARPEVDWIVPISLGDSHRGYRVMGTTAEFFARYKYRGGRDLMFANGERFDDLFDAVVGSDVAAALNYKAGDEIIVAHGLASFSKHNDKPFRVAGQLAKTGTPVDRTVFVSLEAIEAIHVDWQSGARNPGQKVSAEEVRGLKLQPKAITAAMLGVKSRLQIFKLQRTINEYREEPMLAILPGVALQELWEVVGVAETALIGVSLMVVVTALIGMAAMLFSSLNERRREMAILRSVGARPRIIFSLLFFESMMISVASIVLGISILYTVMWLTRPFVDTAFGLYLPIEWLGRDEWQLLGIILIAAGAISILPSIRAYRLSLADGMTIRN